MARSSYFLLLIAMFFLSCRQGGRKHAFYYWKTSFPNDTTSATRIDNIGVDKFYIRLFDVDWSEARHMPIPRAELEISPANYPFVSKAYVPVVFVTNRALEQMDAAWSDTLAVRITKKIAYADSQMESQYVRACIDKDTALYKLYYNGKRDSVVNAVKKTRSNKITEIQIDCDWTARTKDKYFRFLKRFRELNSGKVISATVRLYPYKYFEKTGVPPVDRAMLMCYNLGRIKDATTRTSILDVAEMKQYFTGKDYPLPMDIALPVFGWYAWFRGNKYEGIVHSNETLVADSATFRKRGNSYTVAIDTVIADNYYREGDVLRYEAPSPEDVQAAADFVMKKINGNGCITFFDWNEHAITQYEKAIQAVFAH